jgi:prephenate dehydrogenase
MKIKVAIIGLGLIGGSLAKALKEKAGIKDIRAVSRNEASLRKAEQDGAILRGYTVLDPEVFDSSIIFLCTPLNTTIEYIDILSENAAPDCLVTDVCSIKGAIISHVNQMEKPPGFIGGHPMAGSEKKGYEYSVPHLFENAYYVLTPSRMTGHSHIRFMKELVEKIGGIPVVLDAKTHDKATAAISHVPHLVASALVNMVRECDEEGIMRLLAAGGFKDITRIASSDPEMWEGIVTGNRGEVTLILEKFEEVIKDVRRSINAENSKRIIQFFKQAKTFRDEFQHGSKGLIAPVYNLVIDVEDTPGIIGRIATKLGDSGINIKNINVSNSREMEEGCLRITLPDEKSLDAAFTILRKEGYRIHKE